MPCTGRCDDTLILLSAVEGTQNLFAINKLQGMIYCICFPSPPQPPLSPTSIHDDVCAGTNLTLKKSVRTLHLCAAAIDKRLSNLPLGIHISLQPSILHPRHSITSSGSNGFLRKEIWEKVTRSWHCDVTLINKGMGNPHTTAAFQNSYRILILDQIVKHEEMEAVRDGSEQEVYEYET